MRVLGLISGLAAAFSATAGEYDTRLLESGAIAGQLVYEVRFGGEAGQPADGSLQLHVANEAQRLAGVAPLRAEYRHATGQVLVNGLDLEQTLMSRQAESGIGSALGGWLPLIIVIGAAGLIVVDGQDQDPVVTGTGTGSN